MLEIRSSFYYNTHFWLAAGNYPFFTSNWSGIGAWLNYFQPDRWRSFSYKHLSIQDAFNMGSRLSDLLLSLLLEEVIHHIVTVHIPCFAGEKDKLLRIPDNHDIFSTKSAFDVIRRPTGDSTLLASVDRYSITKEPLLPPPQEDGHNHIHFIFRRALCLSTTLAVLLNGVLYSAYRQVLYLASLFDWSCSRNLCLRLTFSLAILTGR